MNTSKLAQFAAQFCDQLDADFADNCVIGEVSIVLELREFGSDEDWILATCTDRRRYVQIGLLREGIDTIHCEREQIEEDD